MSTIDGEAIVAAFVETRQQSVDICAPLLPEDYSLQAAAFASPPKWHLAHTSWFFETFILKPFASDYEPPQPLYEVLFNSYYNGIGAQHPRDQRGLLSRPPLDEVLAYREFVDTALLALAAAANDPERKTIHERMLLGIEHERQHQELFFTDLKYSLGVNPLYPEYLPRALSIGTAAPPLRWLQDDGGLITIGHSGQGFYFDNELPQHRYFLEPFELASRLVSNGEFQGFVDDGGYQRPELWLADGWAIAEEQGWSGPLHWLDRDGEQREFTLYGLQPRDAARPVCHASGYEAQHLLRAAWVCYFRGGKNKNHRGTPALRRGIPQAPAAAKRISASPRAPTTARRGHAPSAVKAHCTGPPDVARLR